MDDCRRRAFRLIPVSERTPAGPERDDVRGGERERGDGWGRVTDRGAVVVAE